MFTSAWIAALIAFLSVLLVWGWIELAFLSGIITGPQRDACPDDLTGWARFVRAWHTLSYHELLLLCGLLIVTVSTIGSDNIFGFWAYLILFAARISAKLNLFFGVPRINTEFVPKPLQHLKSYFRQGNITIVFVLGVTFLSVATVCFAERLLAADDHRVFPTSRALCFGNFRTLVDGHSTARCETLALDVTSAAQDL